MSIRAAPRPGGRTAETERRIFDATLDLLVEGGLNACGFQAVAERAGVARATLYRRWDQRDALVLDALTARLERTVAIPDAGSFAADLRALLSDIAAFLQSPLGRAAMRVAADSDAATAARRAIFWRQRFAAMTPIIDRCIARGDLPPDSDRELLIASTVGALHFRLLVMAKPADANWIDRIVDAAAGWWGDMSAASRP